MIDRKRLDKEVFNIDITGIRKGRYSDAYFCNIVRILEALSKEGYTFAGESDLREIDCNAVKNGDLRVEMQFFTRRRPFSLAAGVDEALAIIEECTGDFDDSGRFRKTLDELEVEAIYDGEFVDYGGDPEDVRPVLKIRGRYRDFAGLETPVLGVLSEATRLATNIYNVLVAAGGKDVMFFPARFAHYKVQALHGYAYALAVQVYNRKFGKNSRAIVSTDEQGRWWGGQGGGTVAHASIACFLGDTAETMMQFSRIMPVEVPRIALVDFHNDCVGETLAVMGKMFPAYLELVRAGKTDEAAKYKLFAVRLDTSGDMKDVSISPVGDKKYDYGVNPRLVEAVRRAMDNAYKEWNLPTQALDVAREWCRQVKIVVTGGFNVKKISWFEELGVPVDIYGVGSSLLENSSESGTNNDYTADIVRVQINGKWYPMNKVGRRACDNPSLTTVKSK
ncbi:MAG: nicotinate phosphoribosyltransferase [Eubacteriales bacterium]